MEYTKCWIFPDPVTIIFISKEQCCNEELHGFGKLGSYGNFSYSEVEMKSTVYNHWYVHLILKRALSCGFICNAGNICPASIIHKKGAPVVLSNSHQQRPHGSWIFTREKVWQILHRLPTSINVCTCMYVYICMYVVQGYTLWLLWNDL